MPAIKHPTSFVNTPDHTSTQEHRSRQGIATGLSSDMGICNQRPEVRRTPSFLNARVAQCPPTGIKNVCKTFKTAERMTLKGNTVSL